MDTPKPTLCQILAFRGIESSRERARRHYLKRIERRRSRREGEDPGVKVYGIEVVHLQPDLVELGAGWP